MTARSLGTCFLAIVGWTATFLLPTTGYSSHDPVSSTATASLERLEKVDPSSVTVSGLSSGGFFAHQFHVAYSSLVNGAGIVAGGPYGCTEGHSWLGLPVAAAYAAVSICSHYPGFIPLPISPRAQDSFVLIQRAFQQGIIDDPVNLRDDQAWLFLGENDEVVPAATMQALADLYLALGISASQLEFRRNESAMERAANHGIPVRKFLDAEGKPPTPCEWHAPPYIVECDSYEAAGLLLEHLYKPAFKDTPIDPHANGRLKAFDQRQYFNPAKARAGLSNAGYLYVPAACENGSMDGAAPQRCRLHIAFHGCRQNFASVGDDFIRDAAYNGWAAANDIVVLYPQAKAWRWEPFNPLDPYDILANPQGCWDFWGYSGLEYRGWDGIQMRAVKSMVDAILPLRN